MNGITGYNPDASRAINLALQAFGPSAVPESARIPLDLYGYDFIVAGTRTVWDDGCAWDAAEWVRYGIRDRVFSAAEGIADDAYDAHTNRDENWDENWDAVVYEMTSQAVDVLTDPCRTLGDNDHVAHVLHEILYNLILWYDSNLADWHDAGQPDDWDWPSWGERASEMF